MLVAVKHLNTWNTNRANSKALNANGNPISEKLAKNAPITNCANNWKPPNMNHMAKCKFMLGNKLENWILSNCSHGVMSRDLKRCQVLANGLRYSAMDAANFFTCFILLRDLLRSMMIHDNLSLAVPYFLISFWDLILCCGFLHFLTTLHFWMR